MGVRTRSSSCAHRRLGLWVGIALACGSAQGCGGSHAASESYERSNLKPLAILYGRFMARHRGQPPANEAEFKRYVQSDGSDISSSFDVTDAEGLFVSPRDQKPYVVLYGDPRNRVHQDLIAYEQEEVKGRRLVVDSLTIVREVDEEHFRELIAAKP
jgi:hypothetical protein